MAICKICERDTKYHCIKCGDADCTVCSKNVPEETLGYNETIFAVGICPSDCKQSETASNILLLVEKDEDVSIMGDQPAKKKIKSTDPIILFYFW